MKTAFVLSFVAFALACGNTGGGTGVEIDGVTVDCRSPDSDGDRLPDCEEEVLETSARTDDTDGDGLTDFEEIVTRNFDPTTNNFRFNPRIADVPRLTFRLTALPDIRVDYTTSEGTTDTIAVQRTQESSRSVTRSKTYERSHEIEESITTMSSVSILDAGFSVSGSLSESWGESMSWTSAQTRENRQALSRTQETSRQRGTELNGGTLRVSLAVENRGYQSVTLESLVVAASQTDPLDPRRFSPIANLDFDGTQGFSAIEIPPNGSTSDQLIFKADLDLGTTLALLESSRNLVLKPAVWSAVDIANRSFNAPLETIGTKCARVDIDFGPAAGGEGRVAETYFVSAVSDFSNRAITVRQALERIIRVPFESNGEGIDSVRNIAADASFEGRWVIVHTTSNGVEQTRRVFDPNESSTSIDDLELRPGWSLQLIYTEDRDGDGLLARTEFLAGTSDEDPDSDDDGLDDAFEARQGWEVPLILDATERVFSSPSEADLDIDGLNDAEEFMARTNPNNEDSDRDGIRDDLDSAPNNVSALVFLNLDGDTADSSGNGLDFGGTNVVPAPDRFGREGHALRLDGTGSIFSDTVFPTFRSTGASWSFWFRPEGLADGLQGLMDHDVGNSWNALWVSAEGVGGSASSFGRHFIGLADGTGNVTGDWHHVVGVLADQNEDVTGAETFLIYYDGVLRGEITNQPAVTVEPGRWTFGGGVERTQDPPFVGLLDDIRFYERGLTEREVRVLFEHQD